MAETNTITEKEIEESIGAVAHLIDKYGEAYWPLFDRLERELEERKSRKHRLRARLKRLTSK